MSEGIAIALIGMLGLVLTALITGYFSLRAQGAATHDLVNSGMEELLKINKALHEEIGRAKGVSEERRRLEES